MRIVILTYESPQANLMTQRLLNEFPDQIAGIITSDVIISRKTTLQAIWFLLRRTGLGFVAMKGMEIVLGRISGSILWLLKRQPRLPSVAQMGTDYGIPIVGAKKINAPTTRETLRSWQPDLIVSIYLNQLIGRTIIDMPSCGVINVHPALLPKNRGLFPYFWALANGETETGVTVHWVDPKFDTGPIVVQESLSINADDTVISLARRLAVLGTDLLVHAINHIQAGNPPRLPQDSTQASYFSWPTAADVRRFRQQGRRYGSILEMWRDVMR